MHQSGFGGAGRAEQKKVFAAHQANSEQVDDFILTDEIPFHRFENISGEPRGDFGGGHRSRAEESVK